MIQRTSWAIPGIQVVHILCLATLFALALNLSLRVARRQLAKPASVHVFAAALCLFVWSAIIIAGRYIAYVER